MKTYHRPVKWKESWPNWTRKNVGHLPHILAQIIIFCVELGRTVKSSSHSPMGRWWPLEAPSPLGVVGLRNARWWPSICMTKHLTHSQSSVYHVRTYSVGMAASVPQDMDGSPFGFLASLSPTQGLGIPPYICETVGFMTAEVRDSSYTFTNGVHAQPREKWLPHCWIVVREERGMWIWMGRKNHLLHLHIQLGQCTWGTHHSNESLRLCRKCAFQSRKLITGYTVFYSTYPSYLFGVMAMVHIVQRFRWLFIFSVFERWPTTLPVEAPRVESNAKLNETNRPYRIYIQMNTI